MTWVKAVVILYGLINIAMGIQGYQAGSRESLMAGGTAGLLIVIAGLIAIKKPRFGHIMALILTVAVTGNWVMRIMKNGFSAYPAGTGLVLGLVVIACLLGGHIAANSARKKEAAG